MATSVTAPQMNLIDTNLLVYRFDPRDARKQQIAERVLRDGQAASTLLLPHQAIVEFVAAVTRARRDLGGAPLLARDAALRQAERLLDQFPVLWPDEDVLRTALRGASAYGLSWFDAHIWAYAEVHGCAEILSEDFAHGRHIGRVRIFDPFLAASDAVHKLPPLYAADS